MLARKVCGRLKSTGMHSTADSDRFYSTESAHWQCGGPYRQAWFCCVPVRIAHLHVHQHAQDRQDQGRQEPDPGERQRQFRPQGQRHGRVSGGDGANATVTVPTGTDHSVAETARRSASTTSALACTDGTKGTTSGSGITVTAGADHGLHVHQHAQERARSRSSRTSSRRADAGPFDLKVGDDSSPTASVTAARARRPSPPAPTRSPRPGDATDLAKYASSIECDNGVKADGTAVDVTVDSDEPPPAS